MRCKRDSVRHHRVLSIANPINARWCVWNAPAQQDRSDPRLASPARARCALRAVQACVEPSRARARKPLFCDLPESILGEHPGEPAPFAGVVRRHFLDALHEDVAIGLRVGLSEPHERDRFGRRRQFE
jgi:hypothetical protein